MKMMVEQLTDFNKILNYHEIIEVKLEDKDKASLFLNALTFGKEKTIL